MKTGNAPAPQSTRLLDQVREQARYLHYSVSPEKAYVYWVRFFVRRHGVRHPHYTGAADVRVFLTMLAAERHQQRISPLPLNSPKNPLSLALGRDEC